MYIQSIVYSLLKHFQGYLAIYRNTASYSGTLIDTQLEGRGGGLPWTFWNWKNVLILERKALIKFSFGLKFPFKM